MYQMLNRPTPKTEIFQQQPAGVGEIRLYGTIGDREGQISDRWFVQALDGFPEPMRIVVRINSPGGNVYMGAAMRALLAAQSDSEAIVDGIAASAAATVLQGAQRRRIASGGIVMIHRSSAGPHGHASDLRSAAAALDTIDQQPAEMFADRTGRSLDEISEWMKAATYMSAKEALERGFVDEIVSGLQAVKPNFDVAALISLPAHLLGNLDKWLSDEEIAEAIDILKSGQFQPIPVPTPTPAPIPPRVESPPVTPPTLAPSLAISEIYLDYLPAKGSPEMTEFLGLSPVLQIGELVRRRSADIAAACQLAGCSERAGEWIQSSFSKSTINAMLLQQICMTNRPVGGDGITPSVGVTDGAPRSAAEEFRRHHEIFERLNVSPQEYAESRSIEASGKGLDFHGVK